MFGNGGSTGFRRFRFGLDKAAARDLVSMGISTPKAFERRLNGEIDQHFRVIKDEHHGFRRAGTVSDRDREIQIRRTLARCLMLAAHHATQDRERVVAWIPIGRELGKTFEEFRGWTGLSPVALLEAVLLPEPSSAAVRPTRLAKVVDRACLRPLIETVHSWQREILDSLLCSRESSEELLYPLSPAREHGRSEKVAPDRIPCTLFVQTETCIHPFNLTLEQTMVEGLPDLIGTLQSRNDREVRVGSVPTGSQEVPETPFARGRGFGLEM